MRWFLGLDIAKDTFYAVLVDQLGQVVQQGLFANRPGGFKKLLAWLPAPQETLALCEPTGVYGLKLQRALASELAGLHEINAQTLRRFSFSQVRTKTDEADALTIAQALRTLHVMRPETLAKARVAPNAERDNLALWLNEYDRLRQRIAALRNQIQSLKHHPASDVRLVARHRKAELVRLLRDQKAVKQRIADLQRCIDDRQAQLIDSIPGVGPLTTAVTLQVVRSLDRFDSAEALKAYLGLYPQRRQSGKHEGQAGLARHGNQLMRHVLWNAARAAVWNKHPGNPFRALFERLQARSKSYASAIGAVCRKLVQTIYGVLKTQTPFHYQTAP